MNITPGTTQPLEFQFDGEGNRPLNLTAFSAKLVFWKAGRLDVASDTATPFTTATPFDIVCAQLCEIADPHNGIAFTLLNDEQTERISNASENGGVRWGVFLINEEKQVFPMIVSSSGATFGQVAMAAGDLPPISVILGV